MLFLFTSDCSCRSLPGPCVRLRSLSVHRQTSPVTQPLVAAQIHQSLDIHGYFSAKIAFNLVILVDDFPDTGYFRLSEIFSPGVAIYSGLGEYLFGG